MSRAAKKAFEMAKKALVGRKVGMTQLWTEDRKVQPVTVVAVEPLRVVQVKSKDSDGYEAIQVTFGTKKAQRLNKPESGHFRSAGVEPGERLLELRLEDASSYSVGDEIKVDLLAAGELVDVTGTSKGKGFAGTMKRHNFRGQGAAHGNHKHHRAPGSIGACATPARVFKGTRMAGRTGGERVTSLNLEVVQADAERNLLLIKGAVPGPKGGLVLVRDAVKGGA